jgi:hypothetical protein
MKNRIIILSVIAALLIVSCTPKLTNSKYTSVEPWKEWEIELLFKKDSSFVITDRFGSNVFDFSGRWHYYQDSVLDFIVLSDTAKSEYDKYHDLFQFYNKKKQKQQVVRADRYFPVISTDTAWVLNKRQISFRGLTFDIRKLSSKKDLSDERVKKIEDFYISKIGREFFIKTFGEGKGMDEARKNIKEIKDYAIPVKSISN